MGATATLAAIKVPYLSEKYYFSRAIGYIKVPAISLKAREFLRGEAKGYGKQRSLIRSKEEPV